MTETTQQVPRDANRVDLHDERERQYWSNRFAVSAERLQAAVSEVGPHVDAVAERLNG